MAYPRYRQQALPITNGLVESFVGELNVLVKSREKFEKRTAGAEAILQLCAAVRSEDDRLTRFFAQPAPSASSSVKGNSVGGVRGKVDPGLGREEREG